MARKTGLGWLVLVVLGVGWYSSQMGKSGTGAANSSSVQSTPVASPSGLRSTEQVSGDVPARNVSIAPRTVAPAALASTMLYTTTNVRLRTEPSTNSGTVLTVSGGSAVQSVKVEGQWHYVAYGNFNGWIRGDYLAEHRPEPKRTAPPAAVPLYRAPSQPRATQPFRSFGRSYIRGPRGGCYYINRNGNKTYVDRGMCN